MKKLMVMMLAIVMSMAVLAGCTSSTENVNTETKSEVTSAEYDGV